MSKPPRKRNIRKTTKAKAAPASHPPAPPSLPTPPPQPRRTPTVPPRVTRPPPPSSAGPSGYDPQLDVDDDAPPTDDRSKR